MLNLIGVGSFSEVVKARHIITGEIVAIKMIKNAFKDDYTAKKVLAEIQILKFLSQLENNIYTNKVLDIVLSTK